MSTDESQPEKTAPPVTQPPAPQQPAPSPAKTPSPAGGSGMKMKAAIVAIIIVIAVLIPVIYFVALAPLKAKDHAPVAAFTATSTKVLHNVDVTFNASTSFDKDKTDMKKMTYSWSFGDGSAGSGLQATHKYATDGFYDVMLTVMTNKLTNSSKLRIEVYNAPPMISSSLPLGTTATMNEGTFLVFDVNATDPNGDALTYRWRFDGVVQSETSRTCNLSVNYSTAGSRKVMVEVNDSKLNDSKTWGLTIANVNRAPVIQTLDPTANLTLPEGSSKLLKATASDPDGEVLTFTWKVDGAIKTTGVNVTTNYTYAPDYDASGTHLVSVNFTDGALSAAHEWSVQVPNTNRAPTIQSFYPAGDVTILETFTQDFIVNATDLDGDTFTYDWTLDGVAVGANLKTYSFATNYSSNGTHAVVVTLSDSKLTSQKTWNVTVQNLNRDPIAVASVDKAVEFVGYLFQFDSTGSSDPDGDALTFTWEYGDGDTDTGATASHAFASFGTFTVNLTAEDSFGATDTDSLNLTVLKPIPGLTQLWKIGPLAEVTAALIVDVDGDLDDEFVFGTNEGTTDDNVAHGKLYIYNIGTHTEEWSSSDIGFVSGLATGNLDADPALEIAVGVVTAMVSSMMSEDVYGNILIIDGVTHAVEDTGPNLGQVSSLYILDINNDAVMEIVGGYLYNMSFNMATFSFEIRGGLIVYDPTFTVIYNTTGWGLTLLWDVENLDADAPIELLAMCMNSISFTGINSNVSSYEWTGNKPVLKAALIGSGFEMYSSFATADLDADGTKEVLLGDYGQLSGGLYSGNVTITSLDLVEKDKIAGISGVLLIRVADLDGTGGVEIIVGVQDTKNETDNTTTGKFIVYDKDGSQLWQSQEIGVTYALEIADVNGDSELEIVVSSATMDDGSGNVVSTLLVFSSSTHDVLMQATGLNQTRIFIVDVDGDGTLDMLVVNWDEWNEECYLIAYKYP